MKKKLSIILVLVLALGIFTACEKEEKLALGENQDQEVGQSIEEENQEKILPLTSGQEIPYEKITVLMGGNLEPVDLSEDQVEKILESLLGLEFSNSKEVLDTANDSDTIIIKFSDKAYVEMKEAKPYFEDNLYHYNYFKDGDLVDVLVSKDHLREDIRNIVENKDQ
ncbi:MAG: hypothetical protein Q4E36_06325 [Bacillota bacterium]|nr:hypothetical protein [Bacillota bacterium]